MTGFTPDCQTCKNLNCLIRKNSHQEEIRDYLSEKATIQCKSSQNFIIEGSPVYGLYFLYSGVARVARTGINGKEQIIRFAADGEIIGHRGFGTNKFYQVNAMALTDAVVCNFSVDILRKMMHITPSLTYDFMLFYSEELNKSETKVQKFAQMTVREKVIDAILYINRKFGQSDQLLVLQLSRKEIADFAGTTEEQVIRVISSLKKEKLIYSEGKKIGIPDIRSLRKEIAVHNFFIDS